MVAQRPHIFEKMALEVDIDLPIADCISQFVNDCVK